MIRKLSLFLLAVGTAFLAACDAGRESSVVTGPQADLFTWNGALVTTSEVSATTTVTAVIGRDGGRLQNGNHVLIVPRRAVSGDTEFTFTMVGGNNIRADLTAKSLATGEQIHTFASNLTLRLSYANANVSNPAQLGVVWLVDGVVTERAPSYVDAINKQVLGSLSHFSEWGLAEN